MSYELCPKCGEYGPDDHRCKPVFTVWCEDYEGSEEEGACVHALSAEDAVERYAGDRDSYDSLYQIAGDGDTLEVFVRSPEGELTKWEVYGEMVPSYTTAQLADKPENTNEG